MYHQCNRLNEDSLRVVAWASIWGCRNSSVEVKYRVEVNHREEVCRCVVSVVHLGWVDPVVAEVITNACCNSVSSKRLHRERVVLAPTLCRDVSSCQHRVVVDRPQDRRSSLKVYRLILLVAAAQECREVDSVGEVGVRTFGV